MDALDRMQMRTVVEAVVSKRRFVSKSRSVDHQSVTLPMTDGVAVEGGVEVWRVAATVGEHAAHLHVRFLDDCYSTRREKKFNIVRLKHDGGHAWWQAICALCGWLLVFGLFFLQNFLLPVGV